VDFHLQKNFAEIRKLVAEEAPSVVILDSLRSLAPGLDENDSAKTEAVLRPVVQLAQARELAILVLHHTGKTNGDYRGSTAIGAAVQLGFTLSRVSDDPEGRARRRLACWKCRPAPEPPDDRWLTLGVGEHGRILIDVANPFERQGARRNEDASKLLAALGSEPTTWAVWAKSAGLDHKNGTARRARDSLRDRSAVSRGTDGRWTKVGADE
jgi:SpoVK/Ycf46/Vps4 family AAA+-type ATPase